MPTSLEIKSLKVYVLFSAESCCALVTFARNVRVLFAKFDKVFESIVFYSLNSLNHKLLTADGLVTLECAVSDPVSVHPIEVPVSFRSDPDPQPAAHEEASCKAHCKGEHNDERVRSTRRLLRC
jgi:hypothetical protein